MKKTLFALALAVASFAASASSTALTIESFDNGSLTGSSTALTGTAHYGFLGLQSTGNIYVGGLNATYAPTPTSTVDSFVMYCIELSQRAGSFGTGYQYGQVTPVADGTSGGQFSDLQFNRLTNLFGNNGRANTASAAESAAMQLAIWEVLYETGSSLDVGHGSFYETDMSSSVKNAANLLLASADDTSWNFSGTLGVTLTEYNSLSRQDFITGSVGPINFGGCQGNEACSPPAVPEPSSLALMFAGLGAIGFVSRRRKQA